MRYVDVAQLETALPPQAGFDGELLHVVPADEAELEQAERWARDTARDAEPARITVLPKRVRELRELLLDVAALRSLIDERAELETDRPARREVAGRLIEAQQALAYMLADTYGGTHGQWFYRHEGQVMAGARQIDELLSNAADATYAQAPRIWNELIVRRQLSSAAAKARRNLVEAMLTRADQEHLGFIGYPPERAIYASVLQLGGVHRRNAQGAWEIGPPPPDDPLRLQPAWTAMEQFLAADAPEPHPLAALYAHLESPPFGVKAGLTPLLFMALYAARAGEINLYERGNYVPMPDMAVFERLLTRPEQFAVKLSRADGARRQVYARLAAALAPRALSQPIQPALLAVAMPLLRIHHHLPDYSKQTKQLSPQAQALRTALREARSPDELLFERLPAALGLPAFPSDAPADDASVDAFTEALRAGLQELQAAYPHLIHTISERLGAAFGLRGSGAAAREELHMRYNLLAAVTSDAQLHALGIRLETADSEGDAWVTSIAALVAKRPPEFWSDNDVPAFSAAIAELGRRFRAAEELAVAANGVPAAAPLLRVGLTNGRGEVSRVLRNAEGDPAVQQLQAELLDMLGRHGSLSDDQRAAAIASVLQALLSPAP
jgi:hypothetical protein